MKEVTTILIGVGEVTKMPYKTGTWGVQAKKRAKERVRRYRFMVIDALGGKCVKCGNDDFRVLQVDHINGNGYEERKLHNTKNNHYAMKNIRNGDTTGYQLLCANCNWIKRWENNECRRSKEVV